MPDGNVGVASLSTPGPLIVRLCGEGPLLVTVKVVEPGWSAILGIVIEKSLSVTGTDCPPAVAPVSEAEEDELELDPQAASTSASAPAESAILSERLRCAEIFMRGVRQCRDDWIPPTSMPVMTITFDSAVTRRWREGWRPSVWLFDFDGTLVDSVALILDSYRYATATVLGHTPPDDVLRAGIGRPLLEAFQAIDVDHAQEMTDVYRAHNMTRHADLLAGYPGVDELLAALAADGRVLGIVTSKRRDAVDLAIEILGITASFDVIVTWEDTDRHKPLPDPVLAALRRLDAPAEDAIYVGDTAWDIQAGRAAGVVTGAALWGVASAAELAAEHPDLTFAAPLEVLAR